MLNLEALQIQHNERLPFPEPIRGLDPAFREFVPAAVVAAIGGELAFMVTVRHRRLA